MYTTEPFVRPRRDSNQDLGGAELIARAAIWEHDAEGQTSRVLALLLMDEMERNP